MSLLADLLSKKNNSDYQNGKEIPPTLAMAQGASTKVRNHKSRYIALSAVLSVLIAIGLIPASQYERLISFVAQKPDISQKPVELKKVDSPPIPQPQTVPTPPVVPIPTEPEKTVTALVAEKAVSHPRQKKATKRNRTKVKRSPVAAVRPRQRVVSVPASEAIPAPKIDAAMRDSLLYAARSAEIAGDWQSALGSYRKALKIDPDNFRIMSNLAASLNNLGLFDEGTTVAKRALLIKPDYVPAMINAAIAYSSTGNSLEALLLFSKASSADPTNRNLAINLGILQERTGKLEEARVTYRQLADAGDPQALHGMARIYERNGNRTEAVRAYRQIMALPNATATLKKEAKDKIGRLEE